MKKIFIPIFVLITANFGLADRHCVIGDSCKQDGLPGIYSLDKDCPHFLRLEPENRYGHGWCNFSGKNAVICCIGASPVISKARPTVIFNRMDDVCESFGVNTYTPAVDRIFGGLQSFPGEFPHFAALGYNRSGEVSFNCGGTLISDRHVLTAAHCVQRTNQPAFVRLGVTTLHDSPNDGHVDITIEKITRHSEYSSRKKYHDIAIIELKDAITFGPFIWPACLTNDGSLQTNKSLIIAGFGRTDEKDVSMRSDHLLHATVREVPLNKCVEIFDKLYENVRIKSFDQGVTSELICARNVDTQADTCQGDSGGPLKVKIGDKFYVVGITSFGVSCGSSLPAFYTKVSSYIDWIQKVLNPAEVTSQS